MSTLIIWIITVVLIYLALVWYIYYLEKWWRRLMIKIYGPKDFGESLIKCAFTLGLRDPSKKFRKQSKKNPNG